VQGTGTAQNTQNGQALMLVNPSTGKYEAATAATFGGGGGGGDATAANQSTQISEAIQSNLYLNNVELNTAVSPNGNKISQLLEASSGATAANLLDNIKATQLSINKTTKWNTFSSKIYHNDSGTNTFQLNGAVKVVFHDEVIITELRDQTNTSVLSTYFEASGGGDLKTAPNGEIISIGTTADDLFRNIDVNGKCGFTAYYLITPYV
jgi:hypothetical protein